MIDFICPYKCSYRANSGYCSSTGGWERCQYRQQYQQNTVAFYVPPHKKTTNADRIRSMTDEELAEWLERIRLCCTTDLCGRSCPLVEICYSNAEEPKETLDWLKQEG